jgi:hypothetical protein
MGGMQSNKLDDLAITIWSWCKERSIFLTAVHVPGVENTGVNHKSRIFNDSHEWMLKKDIFVRVCKQFFLHQMYIFLLPVLITKLVIMFHGLLTQAHLQLMPLLFVGQI